MNTLPPAFENQNHTMKLPSMELPEGSSPYGAQMGRRNTLPENPNAKGKLRLVRLRWVDGDYDRGGAYWGQGARPGFKFNANGASEFILPDYIFHAKGDLDGEEFATELFIRAKSRELAKREIRERFPNVTFWN